MFKSVKEMFETVDKWATISFEDEYKKWWSTCADMSLMAAVSHVLTEQKLWERKMVGSVAERRKCTETEELGIKYAHVPEKLVEENGFWNPFYIIVHVCKYCLSKPDLYQNNLHKFTENIKDSNDLMVRMCGRALRGMPSPLREDQFAAECATRYGAENVEKSLDLDMCFHCDVKLTYKNRTYFIWSSMQTKNARTNLVSKFTDGRGTPLAAGRHIICLFDRKDEKKLIHHDWELYSPEFLEKLFALIENDTYIMYEDYTQDMLSKLEKETGPVMIFNKVTRY